MAFCISCGVRVEGASMLCPKCAESAVLPPSRGTGSLSALRRLNDGLAGLLCYLPIGPVGVIFSLVFLFVEPYRRNRFVRFHAFQSLLLTLCCAVVLGSLLALSVLFIGVLSPLAMVLLLVFPLLGLAVAITTVVLMVKANAGEAFRLPLIGDLAAKQADAV